MAANDDDDDDDEVCIVTRGDADCDHFEIVGVYESFESAITKTEEMIDETPGYLWEPDPSINGWRSSDGKQFIEIDFYYVHGRTPDTIKQER